MLKIKDGIDLKELEKFGFTKSNKVIDYSYDYLISPTDIITIYSDGQIRIRYTSIFDNILLDKIYDLIKADLVEKSRW